MPDLKPNSISRIVCVLGIACTGTVISCRSSIDNDAFRTLQQRLGSTSFTVFPACVRIGPKMESDAGAADAIAAMLQTNEFGTAAVAGAKITLTTRWRINQARMARESLAEFAQYLKQNPIDTDYAMLPEYLTSIGPDGKSGVGGVHVYLLDRDGRVADVIVLNSHHQPFASANPRTPTDCTAIAVSVLRNELKELQAKVGKGG